MPADIVQLQHDCFYDLPQLESFTLRQLHFASGDRPIDLRHMTKLGCLQVSYLRCLEIYLPPSILNLILDSCEFIGDDTAEDFPALAGLDRLFFTGIEYPKFLLQAARKTTSSKLKVCSLDQRAPAFFVEHDFAAWLAQGCQWFRGLQTMYLAGVKLEDSNSQLFHRSCPNIEQLLMMDVAGITEKFLMDLVTSPDSKIAKTGIQNCEKVSTEFRALAEDRNVAVTFNCSKSSIIEALTEYDAAGRETLMA